LQGVMLVIALSLVLPPPPLLPTPSPDNTRRHPLLPSAPPHRVAAAKPPWSSGHATNTQARPITSAARPTPVRLARGRPSRIIPPPLWSACQTLDPRRLSRHDWPLGSHAKSDARRHRAHTTPGVEGVSCVACPSCACVAAPRPFRMPCQSDRHTHDHDARHIIIHVQPSIAICCSSSSRGRAARGNCLLTGAITHSPFLDVGARSRAKQWDCGVQRADAENGGFIMRSAAGLAASWRIVRPASASAPNGHRAKARVPASLPGFTVPFVTISTLLCPCPGLWVVALPFNFAR
jgi:hypothetical protein